MHAGLGSKPAKKLLGENSDVGKYREVGEMEYGPLSSAGKWTENYVPSGNWLVEPD